jgi:hypothetical protein
VARRRLAASLDAWLVPTDVGSDAALLASELTTNAVVHTLSARILCGVALMTDASLRIEVHDGHLGAGLPGINPGPHDETGRGLLIVRELAVSWGVERSTHTNGNAVWATLRTAPPR